VDSWRESDGVRRVFKFKLIAAAEEIEASPTTTPQPHPRRLIPTHVKLEVWKRDKGRCVKCGATDELHFDHIIPFSRGGTSLMAENVQLLCVRPNLEKRDALA
jgi:5-methylcytosine-specific restriction endonuclease McrA